MKETEMKENLERWIESGEALRELKEATLKAQKSIEHLEELRHIDQEVLKEPFTI